MIYPLDEQLWFPDPNEAERGDYDGLLAVGGDLSIDRLLLAYRSGVFPWSVNPITWWSPDPRGIIEFSDLHISRSLRRVLRNCPFVVTLDQDFRGVITACASTPRAGHWISPQFIDAYTELHRAGHAHSVECWENDHLVGGIYGVSVGGLFAGESMFHHTSNASKVALVHLINHLRQGGYTLFDIQMVTPTTQHFGAIEIPRAEYLRRLAKAIALNARF